MKFLAVQISRDHWAVKFGSWNTEFITAFKCEQAREYAMFFADKLNTLFGVEAKQ